MKFLPFSKIFIKIYPGRQDACYSGHQVKEIGPADSNVLLRYDENRRYVSKDILREAGRDYGESYNGTRNSDADVLLDPGGRNICFT